MLGLLLISLFLFFPQLIISFYIIPAPRERNSDNIGIVYGGGGGLPAALYLLQLDDSSDSDDDDDMEGDDGPEDYTGPVVLEEFDEPGGPTVLVIDPAEAEELLGDGSDDGHLLDQRSLMRRDRRDGGATLHEDDDDVAELAGELDEVELQQRANSLRHALSNRATALAEQLLISQLQPEATAALPAEQTFVVVGAPGAFAEEQTPAKEELPVLELNPPLPPMLSSESIVVVAAPTEEPVEEVVLTSPLGGAVDIGGRGKRSARIVAAPPKPIDGDDEGDVVEEGEEIDDRPRYSLVVL